MPFDAPRAAAPTVEMVRAIQARGPWRTKSGGTLTVRFALPLEEFQTYLSYDQEALDRVPKDVRGLRCYTVEDIPRGAIGANEFHELRQELLLVLQGSFRMVCEDLRGGRREFTITRAQGLWIPALILHTYEALEEGSSFAVIANTLYDPDDPQTHDSYSREEFKKRQAEVPILTAARKENLWKER